MSEVTQEVLTAWYKAVGDSVRAINGIVDGTRLPDEPEEDGET